MLKVLPTWAVTRRMRARTRARERSNTQSTTSTKPPRHCKLILPSNFPEGRLRLLFEDFLFLEKSLEITRLIGVRDDIASSYELARNVKLRNRGPFAEFFNTLTNLRMLQHINRAEFNSHCV